MRPQGLAAIAVATLLVGGGGATVAVRRANRPEPIKDPVLSYEQTETAITVRIQNRNRHWGLRGQRLEINLWENPSNPFNWYGPDEDTTVEGRPELGKIRCCLVAELRPNGTYTFRLHPSTRFRVNSVTIRLVGPPGWIKMEGAPAS